MKISLSEPNFAGNEWKYVKQCIDIAWVSTAGNFVEQFEKNIRVYAKAKYAVSCMNGTAGLYIALLLSGVKPKDEVIVPALTFIAPVNTVKYVGAEPVFMDCDEYLNLDAGKLREFCERECFLTKAGLKNRKTGKIIKAVIPVHVFGNPCDLVDIIKIAKQYRLKVIEDATESLGSYYTCGPYKGRYTGSIGDFGVYSFNGNKVITTGGGGMIITAEEKAAKKAGYLTTQAKDDSVNSIHNEIGYNFRLTNLQAALGVAQLEELEGFIRIKKRNYELYRSELSNTSGLALLDTPEGTRPNYWFYSLLVDKKEFGIDRKSLMLNLASKGIQTRPIWYLNHWQKPYRKNLSYKIEKAVWFWERVLNIPCSSNLTKAQLHSVVNAIKKAKRWQNG